jgi:tetratricopeptide (TPR) repeat protein
MAQDKRPFHQAAQYYYDNKKDMKQALEWATKAAELNPKAYWTAVLKAKIQLELNDKKGAIATAEAAKKLAEEDKDPAYVKQANEIIEKAKK